MEDENDRYARASSGRAWRHQRGDGLGRGRQRPRSGSTYRRYHHHPRFRSRSPRTVTYRSHSRAHDQRRSGSYGTRSRSHSAREAERRGHANPTQHRMSKTSSYRPRSPSPMNTMSREISHQDSCRCDQCYMSYTLENKQAHQASYEPRDKSHSSPRHQDTGREEYRQSDSPRPGTLHRSTSNRSNEHAPRNDYGRSLSRNQSPSSYMRFPARDHDHDPPRSTSHSSSHHQAQRPYNNSFDARQPLQSSDYRSGSEFKDRSERQRDSRRSNHHVIKNQASHQNAAKVVSRKIADNEQRVLETKKCNLLVKLDAINAAMDKEYADFEWG